MFSHLQVSSSKLAAGNKRQRDSPDLPHKPTMTSKLLLCVCGDEPPRKSIRIPPFFLISTIPFNLFFRAYHFGGICPSKHFSRINF